VEDHVAYEAGRCCGGPRIRILRGAPSDSYRDGAGGGGRQWDQPSDSSSQRIDGGLDDLPPNPLAEVGRRLNGKRALELLLDLLD
jgi:hypothetical protein